MDENQEGLWDIPIVTQTVTCDLQREQHRQVLFMKQGDIATRQIKALLYNGGTAFQVPFGYWGVFAYRKADGIGGAYDEIRDGEDLYDAVLIEGSTATILLHEQVLTCPGLVDCELRLVKDNAQLATFTWQIYVEEAATNGAASRPYYNVTSVAECMEAIQDFYAEMVDFQAAVSRGEFDGTDAVVWYTSSAPANRALPANAGYIALNALQGPHGVIAAAGQMIVSTNTGKAYWISGIDGGVALLAAYDAQFKGDKGDPSVASATDGRLVPAVLLTEDEYDVLVAAGTVDPNKLYLVFEDDL